MQGNGKGIVHRQLLMLQHETQRADAMDDGVEIQGCPYHDSVNGGVVQHCGVVEIKNIIGNQRITQATLDVNDAPH